MIFQLMVDFQIKAAPVQKMCKRITLVGLCKNEKIIEDRGALAPRLFLFFVVKNEHSVKKMGTIYYFF